MKVKKFQGGGFIYTPFIDVPSVGSSSPVQSGGDSSSGDSKIKNSTGILDDKVFNKLIDTGGLVNDVDNLVTKLHELQNSSANPFLNTANSSTALRMISEINKLRQSKEIWKEASRNAVSQGSLGEVAVGNSGEVFVKDKDNKLKAVTVSEYKRNSDSLKLLTNAELLQERNYNPNLTGNDNLSSIVNSSVGLGKITDHIKGIISAFGSTSFADEKTYTKEQVKDMRERLGASIGKIPTQDQVQALKLLNDVMESPGSYAKVRIDKSTEKDQLMNAAKYIWSTLGTAAQNKLRVTANLNGYDSPINIILDMANNQTDESTSTTITPIDETTAKGSGSSSSSGDDGFKDKPLSPFEILHNGKTGKQIFNWNDPNTGLTFDLVATGVSKLMDASGKMLGMSTLQKVLDTETGMLVNTNKVYFGNNVINLNDLKNIIYDGREAARVYMPVTINGAPDYRKLEQIKELEKLVLENEEMTPEEINELFSKNGFEYVKVDKDKKYIQNNNFKPFLVMSGYTGHKADIVQNNPALHAMTSTEEDGVADSLRQTWANEKIKDAPIKKFDLFTTYYAGLVAIPYKDDSSIYGSASNKNMLAPQVSLEHARVLLEQSKSPKIGSSELIY